MKEHVLIHCQPEYVERWWLRQIRGLCGAYIVRIGIPDVGETQWHLSSSPQDFVSFAETDYVGFDYELMEEREFPFDRYDVSMCPHCAAHPDLPLLVLATAGERIDGE